MSGAVTEADLRRCFPAARVNEEAAVRLFCLPHAGASASTYRDWPNWLAPSVEVVPVQLPGRETRRSEPLVSSAEELVDLLVDPVLARARGPFALFGHSMGALLAYELAHALSGRGRPPEHLLVAGCAAPDRPPTGPVVHRLPDADVVRHVCWLQGGPSEVLEHEGMRRLLLPVLRADFAVCETYRFRGHMPLGITVTVLGGIDDPTVPASQLTAWRSLSTAAVRVHELPGGHFFLHERLDEVLAIVTAELASAQWTA